MKGLIEKHGGFYTSRLLEGRSRWVHLGRDRDAAIALLQRCNQEPGFTAALYEGKLDGRHIAFTRERVLKLMSAMVSNARRSAAQRGIPFELSKTDILVMLDRAQWKCALTGIPFSADKPAGSRTRPYFPSIDRIDCAAHYVSGNCRVVCVAVNIALGTWGDAVFERIARGFLDNV